MVRKNRFTKISSFIFFERQKCLNCGRCVRTCQEQGIGFLKLKRKNQHFKVVSSENKDCVYCGQCIVNCPKEALTYPKDIEKAEKILSEQSKIVIAQIAPSIRTSIGEEFNLTPGTVVTEKLVGAIKKLGFSKVFDVSLGADFTTVEEVNELIKRVRTKKHLPLLTSCCPSWVKFIEFYYPEYIPNLTTTRSPHIILGGLIKTFWAEREQIDPKKIFLISIMPCVSKKYEIERKELRINGLKPVDLVLTTCELADLFKKERINLNKVKPQEFDSPFGLASGAGIIYGAAGGVMESVLRTLYHQLMRVRLQKIKFEKIGGMDGVKEIKLKVKDLKLRALVINGFGNVRNVLNELKTRPNSYDYIEVMACPGGCIGGGGQPKPVTLETKLKRTLGLYQIDEKKRIRLANENPVVKMVHREFLNRNKRKAFKLFHTKFFPKSEGR